MRISDPHIHGRYGKFFSTHCRPVGDTLYNAVVALNSIKHAASNSRRSFPLADAAACGVRNPAFGNAIKPMPDADRAAFDNAVIALRIASSVGSPKPDPSLEWLPSLRSSLASVQFDSGKRAPKFINNCW